MLTAPGDGRRAESRAPALAVAARELAAVIESHIDVTRDSARAIALVVPRAGLALLLRRQAIASVTSNEGATSGDLRRVLLAMDTRAASLTRLTAG